MKNPFEISDYMTENERGLGIKYVETQGSKFIEDCIKNKVSTVIIGKRGIGKSAAIKVACDSLTKQGDKIGYLTGTRTMSDVYGYIWRLIIGHSSNQAHGICYDESLDFGSSRESNFDFKLWFGRARCRYWNCSRKEKCNIDHKVPNNMSLDEAYDNVFYIYNECPLKRHVLHRNISRSRPIRNKLQKLGIVYIIDAPDNFTKYSVRPFSELVTGLQISGTVVLLMNDVQYKMCENSEVLLRISSKQFPQSNESEIIKIIKGRCSDIIDDNVMCDIVGRSEGNVRKAFQECENFMFGYDKQCYVTKDDDPIISNVIYKLRGKGWMKVKDIQSIIKQDYDVFISSVRLGKKLKKLDLKQRHNPDSEYNIV